MKNKLKILATGMALFLMNPVFAQDMANRSLLCCGKTEEVTSDLNKQMGVDPSEWVTAGNENELLSNMTRTIRKRVNHNEASSQTNEQVSAVRTGKHTKKSIQSKQ